MRNVTRHIVLAASAVGLLVVASPALARHTAKPATAVVIEIAVPPGVSRATVDAGIMASVPIYKKLPGLIYKYFTASDSSSFGGIYIWKSRADAEAHFDQAWKSNVFQKYGSAPKVSYFDVVTTTHGPAGR